MNAPIIWIISPAVVSISLFFIKNRKTRGYLYIVTSFVFAVLTLFIKIDLTGEKGLFTIVVSSIMNILGRSFILFENDKFLIFLVYFFNALWGVASIILKKSARFISFGLTYTAFLLAAVSVEPFLYSALIIEIAVIMSIPLLVNSHTDRKSGISRYLIFQTMAMPFILLAGWFLAGGEINPVNPEQLVQATLLLGLGFIFWLAIYPFHSWVPMVFDETDPINSGFIFLLLQSIYFILILKYINGFAWLRDYSVFFRALQFLGIIMAGFGSIGLFFEKSVRKLIGYEFLHSIGILLVSVGLSATKGITLFTYLIGFQLISFSLLSWSVSRFESLEKRMSVLSFSDLTQKSPIAGVIFLFSLLSLSGMPLTIGFPPLQTLYQYLAADYPTELVLMILSNILITVTVFKLIKEILRKNIEFIYLLNSVKEDLFLFSILIVFIISGFFPRTILIRFEQLVAGFDFLIK
jgi:formate hydrogenlyase subunit 3/multisubunit Na+/H+ antiporter MnhD subunit